MTGCCGTSSGGDANELSTEYCTLKKRARGDMPIFISYSQKDSQFVDKLARQLVLLKHNVWMDRWELKVGDSLTGKVESALTSSSAVIVIISKNSVESDWVKRELNAVLVREIEEKRSLLLPCRVDDCQIPLFLRDKLYADFSKDPDKALRDLDAALSTVSNPFQARAEEPDFISDWAIDWLTEDGNEIIRLHFVDHAASYVVVSTCHVICNEEAGAIFKSFRSKQNTRKYIERVLGYIDNDLDDNPLKPPVVIRDQFEKYVAWQIDAGAEKFDVIFKYRRMGQDTGFDTLVHLDEDIKRMRQHVQEVNFDPGQFGMEDN